MIVYICYNMPTYCAYIYIYIYTHIGFPGDSDGKELACNAEDLGSIPGSGRRIPWRRESQSGESPWTEEPGKLQSMGLQGVEHD